MKLSVSAHRIGLLVFTASTLVLAPACKPKPKPSSELQRKEAELQVAEANFAMNLRDWPRAEALLAKAVQLTPDNGLYWISLGSMRVRQGNKAGAKEAYQSGLKAYEAAARRDEAKNDPDPWLKQMQLLALLGRTGEARAKLDETAKRFPENRTVRAFIEGKQFDRMIADPLFKQGAL